MSAARDASKEGWESGTAPSRESDIASRPALSLSHRREAVTFLGLNRIEITRLDIVRSAVERGPLLPGVNCFWRSSELSDSLRIPLRHRFFPSPDIIPRLTKNGIYVTRSIPNRSNRPRYLTLALRTFLVYLFLRTSSKLKGKENYVFSLKKRSIQFIDNNNVNRLDVS